MKKVALVTGGRRGLGYGIAECLAKDGCDLVICDIAEEAEVAEAMNGLRKLGADVLYCKADITNRDARKAMLDATRKRFGRLNVLVNNAGIAPRERKDILEATEESFELLMKVNLQGPYFLTQAVANWMVEQKRADENFAGCIVNVASISSRTASTGRGEYCISKAGVSMATQLWAVRLGEFNIPVFEVRPGVMKTDMTAAVQAKYDKLIAEGLLLQARWGLPEDVGKAVAMLARGDLPYSTGQVIMIDGGFSVSRL
jgi:NAD(P)-dependent dehydrogenase (short-subunit alcohol dehydrogenase family)